MDNQNPQTSGIAPGSGVCDEPFFKGEAAG